MYILATHHTGARSALPSQRSSDADGGGPVTGSYVWRVAVVLGTTPHALLGAKNRSPYTVKKYIDIGLQQLPDPQITQRVPPTA